MSETTKLNRRQFTVSSFSAGIALLSAPALGWSESKPPAKLDDAANDQALMMQVSAKAFASYLEFEIAFLNLTDAPLTLLHNYSGGDPLRPERASLLMGAERLELQTRRHHEDAMRITSRVMRPMHLTIPPSGSARRVTFYGRYISAWPEVLLNAKGDTERRAILALTLTLAHDNAGSKAQDKAPISFEARAESLLLPRALRPYEHG